MFGRNTNTPSGLASKSRQVGQAAWQWSIESIIKCMQVYLTALEVAFKRDKSVSAEVRALAKRVAGFHSGFVADAAASAAKIVQGGIAYAFQVG